MEDSIGSVLADVSRLMRRSFDERARSIGVTRAQWQVLTMLRRHEGIRQGGLADLLDVEPITLCRMVDRLQEAELVERRRDPADRRIWRLYLRGKARDLLAELQPLADAVMAEMLEGINQKERNSLRLSLEKLRQNLSRRTVEEA
ncbi:MarR family winged helix-turn-helix transcriptional regulator [Haliea sp. E17]|uniref:MarR family winged helix-turn-helix transcriptional regulator n=1 Tax=Haliea sp. E17 TaxID=3401576 RepID=UPI003AABCD04